MLVAGQSTSRGSTQSYCHQELHNTTPEKSVSLRLVVVAALGGMASWGMIQWAIMISGREDLWRCILSYKIVRRILENTRSNSAFIAEIDRISIPNYNSFGRRFLCDFENYQESRELSISIVFSVM
jgi:hypothetical protein